MKRFLLWMAAVSLLFTLTACTEQQTTAPADDGKDAVVEAVPEQQPADDTPDPADEPEQEEAPPADAPEPNTEAPADDGITLSSLDAAILDELNSRYEIMKYHTKIGTSSISNNLEISLLSEIKGKLEPTNISVWAETLDENAPISKVAMVADAEANTIKFANMMTSLLSACDLGLSDDAIKDLVNKYAGTFGESGNTYSGVDHDDYSIFFSKEELISGSDYYVMAITIK